MPYLSILFVYLTFGGEGHTFRFPKAFYPVNISNIFIILIGLDTKNLKKTARNYRKPGSFKELQHQRAI